MIENYKSYYSDENSPIDKLNKIIEQIGVTFRITYQEGTIRDVISTTIDNLDNDNKIHIGLIRAFGTYVCIAQKYKESDYASGLVFGYDTDKILYQRKREGIWFPIREI